MSLSPTIYHELRSSGLELHQSAVPAETVARLRETVNRRLDALANELGWSRARYVRVLGIWRTDSPLVPAIRDAVVDRLAPVARQVMGCDVSANKVSIIYKAERWGGATPAHQDAPYTPESPYSLSTWLPLGDVEAESAPLEFLPGSHFDSVHPPVDYWRPDFSDTRAHSRRWQKDAVAVEMRAGALVAFDPFVWHRSRANESASPRIAIASRWARPNDVWPCPIPRPEPTTFGMYNCGRITGESLEAGYGTLVGAVPDAGEQRDELANTWRCHRYRLRENKRRLISLRIS